MKIDRFIYKLLCFLIKNSNNYGYKRIKKMKKKMKHLENKIQENEIKINNLSSVVVSYIYNNV
jgi:hypothetical protein